MHTAAVVGCGDVSVVHFEALAAIPEIQLVAVCDTDPAALTAATISTGIHGFENVNSLLAHVKPDVVHVCTPHDQHLPVVLECLAAGVNMIIEKPVANTLTDAERLVAAVEASPARVGVCLQNRYNKTSLAAQQILESGELGRVVGAAATVMWSRTADYYRAKPWRGRWLTSGGGLLMNQAIHTVDLLQWLMGDVTSVSGHACTRLLGDVIEVEDTAEMYIRHEGGAVSVFFATLGGAVNHPITIEITAENGSLSLREDLLITHGDGSVETISMPPTATGGRSYWGASHELFIADFYSRLGDSEPFWLGPAEAIKSLRTIKDVYAQSFPLIQSEIS